ncbi:hypothetical protein CDAR_56061 [Caerostris darwini]|uniref:Uncharacterized protein n=1 Tax=Caerostris darwini TaxID=1538125 RepID=A0AAV4RLJ5_9ARAC|nr:hypothetical protein CDAR_56061 [Caerostris darwini]
MLFRHQGLLNRTLPCTASGFGQGTNKSVWLVTSVRGPCNLFKGERGFPCNLVEGIKASGSNLQISVLIGEVLGPEGAIQISSPVVGNLFESF